MSMNICFTLKFTGDRYGSPNIDPFCQTTTNETYYILGLGEEPISKQEQFKRYKEAMYKRFKDSDLSGPLESHLVNLEKWIDVPEFNFDMV